MRLDEITVGENIDRKEKSSKEGPFEISPALKYCFCCRQGISSLWKNWPA
jgi:hypothetical protein